MACPGFAYIIFWSGNSKSFFGGLNKAFWLPGTIAIGPFCSVKGSR